MFGTFKEFKVMYVLVLRSTVSIASIFKQSCTNKREVLEGDWLNSAFCLACLYENENCM